MFERSKILIQPNKIIKKTLLIIIAILIIVGFGVTWKLTKKEAPPFRITNFEECAKAGNPVMESYPRQCRHGDKTFTENIGNELEKRDLVRLSTPRPNQVIQNPLTIKGEARGFWFFEASFPVVLTDWDGRIIAQSIATANGEWMTSEFVPFEATLTFTLDKDAYSNRGTLILRKDNPSGLSEHDDALEIPVIFAEVAACTQEARLCPDGSYVSRTGPNCEFASCSSAGISCQKDSDCPSTQYICEELQGVGTACPSTDPSCIPTHTIIKGGCKLKEGNQCRVDSDCASGDLCNKNICTSPIGKQCTGPSDKSCPTDFECVQGCGSPVGYPGEPPPPYFCQLKGYIRTCPICLAKNTLIDTPQGAIPVQEIQKWTPIWTVNQSGERVPGIVIKTSKTPVPRGHKMAELVLDDGRALLVSPGHPTIDERTAGDLVESDIYNGARVVSAQLIPYDGGYTYDLLVSGGTGFYFANGILLDSTLR